MRARVPCSPDARPGPPGLARGRGPPGLAHRSGLANRRSNGCDARSPAIVVSAATALPGPWYPNTIRTAPPAPGRSQEAPVTRTMYDGVTASRLPTNGQLVAGYVDGRYKWTAADWARFPHAIHVPIAVFSTTDAGVVLDVEPGNATPAESVDWVLARRRAGVDPTVYMNTSTWSQVKSAFEARGVAQPHYWVADYDDSTAIPASAVAHQYRTTAGYDVSSVADYWPGVDPKPGAPAPTQEDEDTVYLISVTPDPTGGGSAGIFTVDR